MSLLRNVARGLRSLLRKKRVGEELDEELDGFLEMAAEEKIKQGMSRKEALRAVRLERGSLEVTKEVVRSVGWESSVETWWQDLRFAARMLRKAPGFAAVAVLTLALGIGANTAIFSLIDAVMLKMLPVREPEQLVLLSWAAPGHPYMIHSLSGNFDRDSTGNFTSTSFSYPIFDAIRDRVQAFSSVLAFADTDRLNVSVGGQADLAQGQLVSGDFFSTLGVPATIGRVIAPADDGEGDGPVAVVSYSYWVRRFGRDPLAVGKAITVNGVPFTLVGVAAPEFFGVQPGTSTDIWIPFRTQPQIEPGWTAYANPGEVSRFTARDDWWVRSRRLHLELANALVIAQVAISLTLLIGAGLFVRTLTNLENQNIGFDRRNLLLFGIDPTQLGYKGERLASFYEELRRRIEALPGVRSASLSRHTFINGGVTIAGVSIQGYTPKAGESNNNGSLNLHVNSVGARFFETFGIPLALGRTINEKDTTAAPEVAVVNRAFARRYLGGSNPIGRRFGFGDPKASSDIVIVGVVGDALSGKLRDESSPTIYVPYLQNVQQLDEMTFEVRTEGNPTQWTAAVRQAVRELDRNLPLFDIKTQTEQIEQASFQERLFSRLSSFFGLLALALTCVGLYGMTSYAVARRTNEIGIRMAMGATRVEVLALIVSQRLRLTLIGVGAGIVGALGLTHFLSTLLYGVKPNDPLTFTVVSLILTGMALIASYIPARRATRVDPLVALRYE